MKTISNEDAVIAVMMNDRSAYHALISAGLREAHFSDKRKDLFIRIVQHRTSHDQYEVGAIEVGKSAKEQDDILNLLINATDNRVLAGSWKLYFDKLIAEYNKIFVQEQLKGLKTYSQAEIYDVCTNIINGLQSGLGNISSPSEIIDNLRKMFEERQNPKYENPFRVGIPRFDQLGHYEPGTGIILGGSSGHGKSTLAINLCYRWAKGGLKVLYVSFEMIPEVVMAKMNCIHTRLMWDNAMNIRGDCFDENSATKYRMGLNDLKDFPIWVVERTKTLPEIVNLFHVYDPDIIVVDTVNHLVYQASQENEKYWIYLGRVVNTLKDAVKPRRKIAVVIAQLQRFTGRPTNKELIGLSQMMKDTADYIDFVYRAKEADVANCPPEMLEIFEVYRVKGRLTGVGSALLHIDDGTGFIRPLSYAEETSAVDALKKHINKLQRMGGK